jgi:hypothetical protein
MDGTVREDGVVCVLGLVEERFCVAGEEGRTGPSMRDGGYHNGIFVRLRAFVWI